MAPMTRVRRARDASSADKLPEDVLFLVLLLLPAKEICRLRTVCRLWRSITSGQAFIREHADRHKEPLLLAKFRDDKKHVYVVDLSGNAVKRIAGADGGLQLLRTHLNLACLATDRNKCRVLNPATGGIRQVGDRVIFRRTIISTFAFGFTASTGEYKLLRCLTKFDPNCIFGWEQLSELQVLTINNAGAGNDHSQWRTRPGPPLSIDVHSGVVVDGVVYFLTSADDSLPYDLAYGIPVFHAGVPADYIVSFDLAREEWRRNLNVPSITGNLTSGPMVKSDLTLADLKGSLVLAHHPLGIMDLWFLLDFESRLWVKQYSIRSESVTTGLARRYHLIPLLELDDGRLVILLAPTGLLYLCDPGTHTFTWVKTRECLD